ncbi:MAG: glycosyltransferase family 2 protein [Moritella sp.]|uniref:glycosyltransferase family 2 protein n=1 Tax=Moritella sp. TaxID=78556 RepID=UPI0029A698FD|nr:glycosyltransferase family 2 protein [Moritella sp.]MDX2319929.1 glycosyltransferase family 2 protein [Moritella sp.]
MVFTVSVIIPSYNCLVYLPKAVESILQQDRNDVEIIIVNDNSTDETAQYLDALSLQEACVKVITTSGLGASGARNMAIEQAEGTYIAFLDADDYWYPEKLTMQLALHKANPSVAMSFTNYDHVNEQYQYIVDCFGYWNQFTAVKTASHYINQPLALVLAHNVVGTSTVMVKASVFKTVGLFDVDMSYCEDWQLWLKICEHFEVAVLTKSYTGYLMRSDSITQTDNKRLQHLACIEHIIADYKQRDVGLSKRTFALADAKLKEGYADYYRTQKKFMSALCYEGYAFLLNPQMRRIKNGLGDIKKVILNPSV